MTTAPIAPSPPNTICIAEVITKATAAAHDVAAKQTAAAVQAQQLLVSTITKNTANRRSHKKPRFEDNDDFETESEEDDKPLVRRRVPRGMGRSRRRRISSGDDSGQQQHRAITHVPSEQPRAIRHVPSEKPVLDPVPATVQVPPTTDLLAIVLRLEQEIKALRQFQRN